MLFLCVVYGTAVVENNKTHPTAKTPGTSVSPISLPSMATVESFLTSPSLDRCDVLDR